MEKISVFNAASQLLVKIVTKKCTFTNLTKENKDILMKTNKPCVTSIVGIVLRNYFLVDYFTKNILNMKFVEDSMAFGAYFGAVAFNKVEDKDAIKKEFEHYMMLRQVKLSDEMKTEIDNLIKEKKNYEFKDVPHGSITQFSIRYNLPIWFLKMIYKQFDRSRMVQIGRECSLMPKQYLFVPSFIEIPETDEEFKSFKQIDKKFFSFNVEKSVKKLKLVHDNSVFSIQKAQYDLLNDLPDIKGGEICVYSGNKDNVLVEVIDKYYQDNVINIVNKSNKINLNLLSVIEKHGLKFNSNEANEDACLTYLSKEQDLICYLPQSSSFEEFRRTPDYGIQFDVNNLDGIIDAEMSGLNNLAKFVAHDGYLIYAVNTLNIKETEVLVMKFLENNPNFKYIKKELYFPNEKANSLYFYVIFKKK